MAKARSSSGRPIVISQPRPAAPIVRVSAPRAPARRRGGRRRAGGGGGSLKDQVMKVAIGGAVLGFLEKQGTSVPTIPVLGRTGTIALIAYFVSGGKPGIARDVCLAATAVAGSQIARDGKISGDDD